MAVIFESKVLSKNNIEITKISQLTGLYYLSMQGGNRKVQLVIDSEEALELTQNLLNYLERNDLRNNDSWIRSLLKKALSLLATLRKS